MEDEEGVVAATDALTLLLMMLQLPLVISPPVQIPLDRGKIKYGRACGTPCRHHPNGHSIRSNRQEQMIHCGCKNSPADAVGGRKKTVAPAFSSAVRTLNTKD